MTKVTGIYVNAEKHSAAPISIESKLDAYYELLDVSCIDIVSRKIGGKYYDIICDDEALLKANPICSMIDSDGKPMLFGNLFICSHDGEGNEISLSPDDIPRILRKMQPVLVVKDNQFNYQFILGGTY